MVSADNSTITIVAGGWSALHVKLHRLRGRVIAVNDAARHLPVNPDIVVSMDRLWTEARWKWLKRREAAAWIRASALQNLARVEVEKASKQDRWLRLFCCDNIATTMVDRDEYSEDSLNGTNSGMCALNLAYQMRPEIVYLLGFDMNRSPQGRAYWHASYPWANHKGATSNRKYADWATQFDGIADQFKAAGIVVRNVSSTSAIQSFKKMKPEEYNR